MDRAATSDVAGRRFDSCQGHVERKQKGRIAEAKVIAHFVEHEYEVYIPLSDGSKFDLIIRPPGTFAVQRVSVKYTSSEADSGNWEVSLRNCSRRNHGKFHVDLFDAAAYDLLAVYIGPEDRVVVLPCDFLNKNTITVGRLPER